MRRQVASGEQAVTEFVDHERNNKRKHTPPERNHRVDAGNGKELTRRKGCSRRRGRDQRGDEGQKDDQRNHQHGHRTNPERHLTVRSPEPTRSRHPVQKPLPTLGPNHQHDSQRSGCVPAVKGPVAFPRANEDVPSDEQGEDQGPIRLNRPPRPHHASPTRCSVLNIDTPAPQATWTNLDDGSALILLHAPPQHGD